MIKRAAKRLLERMGVKAMSMTTWHQIERALRLVQAVELTSMDLLSVLVDREFVQRRPFFVQVGANDGVRDDQLSRFVKEHRWCGMLIEPQPDAYKRLKANYDGYDGLIFENVAIGVERGELSLYRFKGVDRTQLPPDEFTSADRSRLERASALFGIEHAIEEMRVPVVPLASLLEKYCIEKCDILMIDTEGMDYEVIRSFNFAVHQPVIMQFEHVHLSDADLQQCLLLLKNHGYEIAIVKKDIIAHRRLGSRHHRGLLLAPPSCSGVK